MDSFEIRVTINRPLLTVFSLYTNTENWKWCPYILDAQWVRGRPWEEESRMRLTINGSVGNTVDQVLTHFEANQEVAYLSHFSGITMETRLSFRSLSENETEIYGRMEFLGVLSRVVSFAIKPTIERSTKQFFEDLKRGCESTQGGNAELPKTSAPDRPYSQ